MRTYWHYYPCLLGLPLLPNITPLAWPCIRPCFLVKNQDGCIYPNCDSNKSFFWRLSYYRVISVPSYFELCITEGWVDRQSLPSFQGKSNSCFLLCWIMFTQERSTGGRKGMRCLYSPRRFLLILFIFCFRAKMEKKQINKRKKIHCVKNVLTHAFHYVPPPMPLGSSIDVY